MLRGVHATIIQQVSVCLPVKACASTIGDDLILLHNVYSGRVVIIKRLHLPLARRCSVVLLVYGLRKQVGKKSSMVKKPSARW